MEYIVLDIETTGLSPVTDVIHGIGVAWPDGSTDYFTEPNARLVEWLRDPTKNVVGHNLRFDIKFIRRAGFEVNARLWDTKLLAQLINENQELGLKPLSLKYFGASSLDNKREIDRAVSSIDGKSVADLCRADIDSGYSRFCELIATYCIEDCVNTHNLWEKLTVDIKAIDEKARNMGLTATPLSHYLNETMPLELVLADMELAGIRVDVDMLKRYRSQILSENDSIMQQMLDISKEKIDEIEEELYGAVLSTKKSDRGKANVLRQSDKYGTRFNWSSADHLSKLFFEKFELPTGNVERTPSGRLSVSEDTFSLLAKDLDAGCPALPLLTLFARWKKNFKLLSTYTGEDKGLVSQLINGRIHSDYLQVGHGKESSQGGTVTGRLSSRRPNMQNLPRGSEVKRFFVPDPGNAFIYLDYSQLELRLAAHLSQDPLLIQAYREGLDLHQLTADAIGEDRQVGKTINFAMIYDASPWRLADILQRSPEQCEPIIDQFYNQYKGYAAYLRTEKKKMLERGWLISETGRVRRLPELKSEPRFSRPWKHAIKQGYNFPIQSLGSSICKRAMIVCWRRGFKLVTSVHDSIVIQAPAEACPGFLPEIVKIAETVYPCSVPIKVDAKILTSLHESDKLEV